uniref:Uncharacterized protein n=1 Tax=Setaria italica TaxID=4555 RepID=K3ZY45_SETIT
MVSYLDRFLQDGIQPSTRSTTKVGTGTGYRLLCIYIHIQVEARIVACAPESGAKGASMEVVLVMGVILVVQVQAKTEPCTGFAECCFLCGCNGVFPAALMDLRCARSISVCLNQQRYKYTSR